MKRFLFQHRDGQTPVEPDYHKDLIPSGIQNWAELNEHEEQNIALGLSWLEKQENADPIDVIFWKKLHKQLFENVWVWAGKIRTIELGNDEFVPLKQVQTKIRELEDDLLFWLQESKLDGDNVAARFHEKLLTIHPFVNGNGRWARILTNHVCERTGLPIPSWSDSTADQQLRRDSYIAAVRSARLDHQFQPLIDFMFNQS